MTSIARMRACGIVPTRDRVQVRLDADGVARYGHLMACGSVWSCPVCSAAIRQRRAVELEAAATGWLEAGHGLVFVTLTMPHGISDSLGDLLALLLDALAAAKRGRGLRAVLDAFGSVGPVRATEITHGRNGWHPHLHLLWFFERPLLGEHLEALQSALDAAWRRQVLRLGRRTPNEHGCRVQSVTLGGNGGAGLGAYLAKVQDGYGDGSSIGQEMARGDLKRGRQRSRTPFEVLEDGVGGDRRSMALWYEYERSTRGRRCLEWSRLLRTRLQLHAEESDEEAAAAADGEVVASISREDWSRVIRFRGEPYVLNAAEVGGSRAVYAYLADLRRHDLVRGRHRVRE